MIFKLRYDRRTDHFNFSMTTQKISIEKATKQNLQALVEIENACFTTDRFTQQQYRYYLSSPSILVLIAKKNQVIAGSAVILFRKNSKKIRIYSIAVLPEYQHHGIAQALHDAIEVIATKRRCTELHLEVKKDNTPALQFYLKNTYQLFGEYKKYYEDGKDALRMRKKF